MNSPQLETERLILRKFTDNDLEALFAILKDEKVNTFLPWFPLKSMEEAQAFYESVYLAKYRMPQAYAYALCRKEDNTPVGYVNVETDDSHDMGYAILPEFQGRGYVTEAASAVIAQVKKDGIPYITATHDVKNPKSGGVMQRLGMHYQYSYEEQWQPKDIPVIFRMYQLNFDKNDHSVYRKYQELYPVHFIET